jgi:hypothetical protein
LQVRGVVIPDGPAGGRSNVHMGSLQAMIHAEQGGQRTREQGAASQQEPPAGACRSACLQQQPWQH